MNTQETEVKFYVNDLKRVEARLRELGATLIQPRVYESNLRFDTPDAQLRRDFKALRLRQDQRAQLTYKGPSTFQAGVRTRPEFETSVEDFEVARQILEALGYVVVATYEKYRSTYALENLHFMLDELPYGNFVEIEGQDIESIRAASERLDLDFSAAINNSYLLMFEALCQKRTLAAGQLTFVAFEGVEISAEELEVRAADEMI